MPVRDKSALEYEEDADRARVRLGGTIVRLKSNLAPSNLADQIARGSGFRDASAASAIDFATKRYPIPTLLIALGVSVWAYSTARSRSSRWGAGNASSMRDTVDTLTRSATNVFRQRAGAKREEFVVAESSHIAAGASQLSDTIENGVDDLIHKIPASPAMRRVIESAVQMALLSALEALAPKSR